MIVTVYTMAHMYIHLPSHKLTWKLTEGPRIAVLQGALLHIHVNLEKRPISGYRCEGSTNSWLDGRMVPWPPG